MYDNLRMKNVQPPIIPIVGELIRNHPGTISLGQGVVGYGPPDRAIEYIQKFLSTSNNHKYNAVQGIAPLIDKIRHKLELENHIDAAVDGASRICVTAGANMAFKNAILAICDPGDEVILLTPYYFNHEMAIHIAGCKPVLVGTDENYQPVVEDIANAITDRTRAVVTISPNNPSGAVYPESTLGQINGLCEDRNIYHISDEAYEYFTYGSAEHFSPGSIKDSGRFTISLFSLSKAYGFASWRIGYMVLPSRLEASIKKIQDTILICPPVISQYAALGALETGSSWCLEKLSELKEVRTIMQNELAKLKDICVVPPSEGAFYFLIKVLTDLKPMDLTKRLIKEHRVAVIPGQTFGLERGCYLRASYGPLQKETATEGITRLSQGLRAIV